MAHPRNTGPADPGNGPGPAVDGSPGPTPGTLADSSVADSATPRRAGATDRPAPPPGYLDAASTEPLHPAARQALIAALDHGWADPSRRYHDARRARMLLDAARESVAAVLGARPDEVSFTTSGTQAVQLAVAGLVRGRERAGHRVLASAVEHSSVLHAATAAVSGDALTIEVDALGRVSLERLRSLLAEGGVALVAVQSANHEVGTRQPLGAVSDLLEDVPLLVDAAQSIGREPAPGAWSVLTASAHKWGGPAGVGVLAVRTGVRWRSPSPAGALENGRVPGFVDVPAVVAAASALEAVERDRVTESARLSVLVDRIRARVALIVPDVVVLGDPVDRLPHVVTFSCLYVEGEALLADLDRAGFAVSSGSSCVADSLQPSHVLAAMGALTHGNLRISLPNGVRDADVDRFLDVLPGIVARVRSGLGADGL